VDPVTKTRAMASTMPDERVRRRDAAGLAHTGAVREAGETLLLLYVVTVRCTVAVDAPAVAVTVMS
jgi:hypothetical protein